MSEDPRLQPILARLTPESLSALVHSLAAQQPADSRQSVSVLDIQERLLQGLDLGSPAETWRGQLALRRAIADTIAQIPDMEYVEGDS